MTRRYVCHGHEQSYSGVSVMPRDSGAAISLKPWACILLHCDAFLSAEHTGYNLAGFDLQPCSELGWGRKVKNLAGKERPFEVVTMHAPLAMGPDHGLEKHALKIQELYEPADLAGEVQRLENAAVTDAHEACALASSRLNTTFLKSISQEPFKVGFSIHVRRSFARPGVRP